MISINFQTLYRCHAHYFSLSIINSIKTRTSDFKYQVKVTEPKYYPTPRLIPCAKNEINQALRSSPCAHIFLCADAYIGTIPNLEKKTAKKNVNYHRLHRIFSIDTCRKRHFLVPQAKS